MNHAIRMWLTCYSRATDELVPSRAGESPLVTFTN